jgi:hypothetical protein
MKTLSYDKNTWVKTKQVEIDGKIIRPHESNLNEENRINYIGGIASVTRNKDTVANPEKRYKNLMTEAESNSPDNPEKRTVSRVFEFLPVKVEYLLDSTTAILCEQSFNIHDFNNKILRFAYSYNDGTILTNMRALLNAGIPYEKIPYNQPSEIAEFKVVELNIPMFSWAQLYTHQTISKLSVTDRIVKKNNTLYFPEDIESRVLFTRKTKTKLKYLSLYFKLFLFKYLPFLVKKNTLKEILNHFFINKWSQQKVQNFMQSLGYGKEIYQRYPYYASYKRWIFAGNLQDPMALYHMFKERQGIQESKGHWVQPTTKEIAKLIADELGIR